MFEVIKIPASGISLGHGLYLITIYLSTLRKERVDSPGVDVVAT